jgi:phenylacetic acid degradation operon negative regulatory protein
MGNKKSLSYLVLLALEKAVDGFVRIEDLYRHGSNYAQSTYLPKSQLAQSIKRLRENGLIDFIDDEKLVVRLTDSGKDKALWLKMRLEDQKWDGKWRLVIWDIPETRRIARDVLRFKLKQLGFTRWQRSVWISKKNCTKLLRDYIKSVGISDWVKVIESSDIGK